MTDKKVEKAVTFMEDKAKNNEHGYDQKYRWAEKGDYDCSSLVITAFEQAGFLVKTQHHATYTGNMKQAFLKCGFKDIKNKANITTGKGLKRGDILLNEAHHVAVYCGNGYIVQASINEKGTAMGGKPGDQTGQEINISHYKNYYRGGWNSVLRFKNPPQEKSEKKSKEGDNEMIKIIEIETDGKVPTVNAINKDGNYFVKLRDLDALGLLKVDYNKTTKRPIVKRGE